MQCLLRGARLLDFPADNIFLQHEDDMPQDSYLTRFIIIISF